MTPALRKALIESGALIPTTPTEVRLAQRFLTESLTPDQIDAAFSKLDSMLETDSPAPPFIELDEPLPSPGGQGMASAARNGSELSESLLARIDEDVDRATS
jgi:hypothetical protein